MTQDAQYINRKIVISSAIDDNVAGEVVSRIMEINDYDSQMSVLSTYQPSPIEIFINSNGGMASSGFAIIGAMEMSETPIVTYAMGQVASMALGIFVKGDVRVAHRYVRMMYHSVAYGQFGNIKDHEDGVSEANLMQAMYDDLFANTKLSKEKMAQIRLNKSNFFFSGREAVDLGIADNVTSKPVKIELDDNEQEHQDELPPEDYLTNEIEEAVKCNCRNCQQ